MSRDLADLLPDARALAEQLLAATEQEGFPVFITSTLRTFYEQTELYAQGRTKPGPIVTYAQGGESRHNHGLAFDVAFVRPAGEDVFEGPWEQVGAIGRELGLEWGGDWTSFIDMPHFQIPSPYGVGVLKAAATGRLRRGIRAAKANVRELQTLLNRAGLYEDLIDGDFGPNTEEAV
jgi:peptidoglycan L-alanyl-D-glutamate endopeptidase CwlK